jgi:LysM repeat protein
MAAVLSSAGTARRAATTAAARQRWLAAVPDPRTSDDRPPHVDSPDRGTAAVRRLAVVGVNPGSGFGAGRAGRARRASSPASGRRPMLSIVAAERRPADVTAEAAGRRLDVGTWARAAAVATVAAVVAVAVALPGFLAWVAGPDPTAALAAVGGPSGSGAPASVRHQVQPGDSLWSIAARLQPEGDVRPMVDLLVAANGGSTVVHPGQELVVSP